MGRWHFARAAGGFGSVVLAMALAQPADALPRIRPGSPEVEALLQRGLARSATFRRLADRIESGPVIVYVRFARCEGAVAACLHFLGAYHGEHTARITLDRVGRSEMTLCVLLAHELQHAAELIDAGEVVSHDDFQRFMTQVGRRSGDGFETSEAVRAARAVERELAAAPGEEERAGA